MGFIRIISEQPASAYRLISRQIQHLRRVNEDLLALADDLEGSDPGPSAQQVTPQALTLHAAVGEITSHVPKEGVTISTFGFSVGRVPRETRGSLAGQIFSCLIRSHPACRCAILQLCRCKGLGGTGSGQ
ncbi:MAG: hypothetical protein CM1200mP20_16720 [Pseudomonadota bacterium]|nr:MAG: hypothetical protein CM1200mP20_16720 [Pseudomonadota bacterium]